MRRRLLFRLCFRKAPNEPRYNNGVWTICRAPICMLAFSFEPHQFAGQFEFSLFNNANTKEREREREREWNVYNRRQKQTCKHLLSAITFKDCLFAHDNMTSRERREERESQRGIISIDMFLAIDIIRRKLDISLSTIWRELAALPA